MTLHVKPRKFSVEEYARMGEAGIFPPGERVELIEGEIIPVSPQNRRHASRTARINTWLVKEFGDTHEIRVQLPLTLNSHSEPDPDFALVLLEVADAAVRHPECADLVIEIADSSLSFDRTEKASVYAKAGIPDYWVLNLPHMRLEVRREPAQDSESTYGWGYTSLTILAPGLSISPLCDPRVSFSVSKLLGL